MVQRSVVVTMMVVVTLLPFRVVVAVVAVVLFLPGKRGRFLRDGLPSSDGWEGPGTTVGARVPPLAATPSFALTPFLLLSSSSYSVRASSQHGILVDRERSG